MLPRSLDDVAGLRAARWIRESTKAQSDRFGPAAQRERQDDAIKRYGLIDTGIVYDVAHSGRTVSGTPEWAAMVGSAGRSWDVLVIGYVSRFSRDLRSAINARHDLHASGAVLLFADERIVSSDETAWDQWAREAVEAESYSRRLSRRVREGFAAKIRTEADYGSGETSYGFRRVKGLIAPDPRTMPNAVRAYELSADGATDAAVAAATGITLWAVRTLLTSPLYGGMLPDGRPTRFPAPVPLAIRERAIAARSRRVWSGHSVRHRVYPLTDRGPLVCDACGRPLAGAYRTDRSRRVHRHPAPCEGWSRAETSADHHEAQVAQMLMAARPDRRLAGMIRTALSGPAIAPDRLAIARIDAALRTTALALVHGADPKVLERLEQLRARRADILATPVVEDQPSANEAIEYLGSLGELWRDTSDEGRRELARSVFARLGAIEGRIVSVEATPAAERRGLALALPTRVGGVGGTGIEPVTSSV